MVDIPGYEGLYAINEKGELWSYPKRHGPYNAMYKGHWMKASGKYPGLFLHNSVSEQAWHSIHRLVAICYLPNWMDADYVMHLDDNTKNFHVSNLMWGTAKQNEQDKVRKGRSPKHSGQFKKGQAPWNKKETKAA
jgi:hypothetical protein